MMSGSNRFIAQFFLLCLICTSVNATPIITTIPQHSISLYADFKGEELMVFGALEESKCDVIVVVSGPEALVKISKKEQFLGMWVNKPKEHIDNTPLFYTISSNVPLEEITTAIQRKRMLFGIGNLILKGKKEFVTALKQNRIEQGLYTESLSTKITNDKLFNSIISFPSNTPAGRYVVETFAIKDKQIIGMQVSPLLVAKQGFESYMFNLHDESPILYGLLAVFCALITGFMFSITMKHFTCKT